ncbi:MAG: hypothetical protein ACOCXA_04215, partial [Planctomycetota bacterium]
MIRIQQSAIGRWQLLAAAVVPLLLTTNLASEEGPEPLAPLTPRSDFLMFPEKQGDEAPVVQQQRQQLDIEQLTADVAAMSRAAERLRAALRQNKVPGFEDALTEQEQPQQVSERRLRQPDG